MANIPLLATAATLKAAGAESVSTTGAAVQMGTANSPGTSIGFWLASVAITAVSGTPTLLVVIEGSANGGGTWQELATIGSDGVRTFGMTALPAPFTSAVTVQAPVSVAKHLRYRSIIGGGTPSVTYSVSVSFFSNPNFA